MEDSFEQQYLKIERSLYLVALGYLHNTEDARDAVSEAVIRAYQSYEKLRHPEYFKTWMTRIVINQCKSFLKKHRYTAELTDNLNLFYELPVQELEIVDAVCRLDAKLIPYITLRFYNDMNYSEVAKLLNLPLSTVKYRTKTAMTRLKTILEGDA